MTPKIFPMLVLSCTILALGSCTKKKKTGKEETEYSCSTKHMAFDSVKKICKEPDAAFCASNFMILSTGGGNCVEPTSQSDCNTIGKARREFDKTFTWRNGRCTEETGDSTASPDPHIEINWQAEKISISRGQNFPIIGRGSVKLPNDNFHNIIILRKDGSVCDLKIGRDQGDADNAFIIQAMGVSVEVCAGTIFVANTLNGTYNTKKFSVRVE